MAQITTTLTITHAEVLDILKVHFNLRDDTHITITDQEDDGQDGGWIAVNPIWNKPFPPEPASFMNRIEVVFDDGGSDRGKPDDWCVSWDQSPTNTLCRIVKYRRNTSS